MKTSLKRISTVGPKSGWGPPGWGGVRLSSQTSPIPRAPDGDKKIMGDIWYANIVKTTRHNFCIDFVMDFAPNGPKGLGMAIQGQKRPSLGRNHNVD